MRSFPFAFAHIKPVIARGATPINARTGFAIGERPELPEGFASARTAATMHTVNHRGRDFFRSHNQRWQTACEIQRSKRMQRFALCCISIKELHLRHGSAKPLGELRDDG
jgi:hypothetical protein